LESLGIKEHFIAWDKLSHSIVIEFRNNDEGEESINAIKVIFRMNVRKLKYYAQSVDSL
jgi:hypothetical protein